MSRLPARSAYGSGWTTAPATGGYPVGGSFSPLLGGGSARLARILTSANAGRRAYRDGTYEGAPRDRGAPSGEAWSYLTVTPAPAPSSASLALSAVSLLAFSST